MAPDPKRAKVDAARRMRKSRAIRRAMRDIIPTPRCDQNSDNSTEETGFTVEPSQAGPSTWQCENDDDRTESEGELNEEKIEDELEELPAEDSPAEEEDYYSAEEEDYYSPEDSEVNESENEDDNIEVDTDESVAELVCPENIVHENEIEQLRKWAIECHICQSHLDKLICILKPRLLPDLPKSAKTLLKTTSAKYNIERMQDSSGGNKSEFVYFGLTDGLKSCINTEIHCEDTIYLQINIDGLPLYKSSLKQFWPILCKVDFDPDIYRPFPVAIYSGDEKPKSIDEYLEKFVEEVNLLQRDGILIDERIFKVGIKCFIADTPARTFMKCTKGHGGYAACERCTVYGERCNRRMIYSTTDCMERTDATFRAVAQPEHHNGISPLTRIEPKIDMVNDFVLDFMHLCCLGVLKKLLNFWLEGNLNFRLSRACKVKLSERMKHLRSQVPCEFERKPRSVFEIAHWKATEFRFFLLYCGPVVLKNILSSSLYKHFLLLHVSCRILCTETLCLNKRYTDTVKIYLKNFFLLTREYYGADSHVINLHNLTHLVTDVENMKCSISRFTAFPFENLLGKIKKMLRSGNRPLAQVCRRVHEAFFVQNNKVTLPPDVVILKKGSQDRLDNVPVLKLKYGGATLTNTTPNNYVILRTQEIVKIDRIFMNEGITTVIGRTWKVRKPLFTYPFDSKILKMWELQDQPLSTSITFPLRSIESKMVILSLEDNKKFYAMPYLHM